MNNTTGSVRLDGVIKRHGATTVLHGIDLAIEPGEFFVLLGPSGSGKTTTLRVLAGLESVSGGRVLMDGQDVTHREPGERDVAMVFQSYALYPHMTVAENIGFPLKMVGICSPADRASCRAASSSASRSRAPSCAAPTSSCSTSRCRTSTPSSGSKPASSCMRCSAASASPRSM